MIDLSVTAGNVFGASETLAWRGARRNFVAAQLSAAGQTLLPRDAFQADAAIPCRRLLAGGKQKKLAGGKMFIQPKVTTGRAVRSRCLMRSLARMSPFSPGLQPTMGLNAGQIAQWRAVGCDLSSRAGVQIHRQQDNFAGVIRVGDTQNRLKSWFCAADTAIAVVRPDRFVAAVAIPQTRSKR